MPRGEQMQNFVLKGLISPNSLGTVGPLELGFITLSRQYNLLMPLGVVVSIQQLVKPFQPNLATEVIQIPDQVTSHELRHRTDEKGKRYLGAERPITTLNSCDEPTSVTPPVIIGCCRRRDIEARTTYGAVAAMDGAMLPLQLFEELRLHSAAA